MSKNPVAALVDVFQASWGKERFILGLVQQIVVAVASIFVAVHFYSSSAEPFVYMNVGIDLLGVAIDAVLYIGCMSTSEQESDRVSELFALMLMLNSLAFLCNECTWLMDGVASLRGWNIAFNVAEYSLALPLTYSFWRFVNVALRLKGRAVTLANRVIRALLIPAELLCLVNLFVPLYFYVDANGYYHHAPMFWISKLFMLFVVAMVFVALFLSNATRSDKVIVLLFASIPLLHYILTIPTLQPVTEHGSFLVSIVLMYSVIFAQSKQKLVADKADMDTAASLQASMLPSTFPPYPDRTEFDLYAVMDPAKAVGGDFYDFFLIDDDHLALVIADVSGKGMPAALFMMSAKILIHHRARQGGTPAEILGDVNRELCENNPKMMFVTVWLGILDIPTGIVTCVNAGHEYPAVRGKDGQFHVIDDAHGIMMGAVDDFRFTDYEIALRPGDAIFLYTDGVPEANNEAEELFGMQRMEAALNHAAGKDPEGVLEGVRQEVDRFVSGANQFDDLTMLCLSYKGPK